MPRTRFNIVVLGLLQVTLHLKLLSQVLVGVLEKVLAELGHQADHVVVLLSLLVHVDGKVWLVSTQVHALCILEEAFTFELASLLHIEHCVLRFREITRNNLIGLVPLVAADIHFKGFNKFSSIDEVFFSKIKLSDLSVVSSDLFVVRSADLRRLISNQLDSSIPFPSTDGGFNGLAEYSSLNEVLNGEVKLLLRLKPVTPFLFEVDDVGRECSASQVNGLAEGMTSNVAVKGAVEDVKSLQEFTCFLKHA